eukprot:70089_1
MSKKRKLDTNKSNKNETEPSRKKQKVSKKELTFEQKLMKYDKTTLQLVILKSTLDHKMEHVFEEIMEEINEMNTEERKKEIESILYQSANLNKEEILKRMDSMYNGYYEWGERAKKVSSRLSDTYGSTIREMTKYAEKFMKSNNLQAAVYAFDVLADKANNWHPEKMDFSFGGPFCEISLVAQCVEKLLKKSDIRHVDNKLIASLYDSLSAFRQSVYSYSFD